MKKMFDMPKSPTNCISSTRYALNVTELDLTQNESQNGAANKECNIYYISYHFNWEFYKSHHANYLVHDGKTSNTCT